MRRSAQAASAASTSPSAVAEDDGEDLTVEQARAAMGVAGAWAADTALEMTAVRESGVPTAYEPPDAVWNGIIAGRAALDGRLPAAGTLLSLPAAAGRLGKP